MNAKFQVKIFNTQNMTANESQEMNCNEAWEVLIKAEEMGFVTEMWRNGEKMCFTQSDRNTTRLIEN